MIGAGTVLSQNVDDGKLAIGNPSEIIGDASLVKMRSNNLISAYPWKKHFKSSYYPKSITDKWDL